MTIQLYHCKGARSLRPLWTMEEMGIDYELHVLPFPPRVFQKDYLGINILGTIPYMIDGDARMTESSGMAKYLVDRYGPTPLGVDMGDPEYPAFLNWLFYSDATLTFPQTLFLRYTTLEPEERRVPQVAEDYRKWFLGRLRLVEQATSDGRGFLCCGRFTIADICVGYGLHFAAALGIDDFGDNVRRYWKGLQEMPSYQRIREI